MGRLLATIRKDILLLWRDRTALALLFLMPVALVLIISLVHDGTLKNMAGTDVELLLVDRDGGAVGQALNAGLSASGFFRVVDQIDGQRPSERQARQRVAAGDFEVCLIIAPGASAATVDRARDRVTRAFLGTPVPEKHSPPTTPSLQLCFNAEIMEAARYAVLSALQSVALEIDLRAVLEVVSKSKAYLAAGGKPPDDATAKASPKTLGGGAEKASHFSETFLPEGARVPRPSASEHNVAAWALFGMFFIVIPLAANLIHERQSGTWGRLRTMPVSPLTLLLGKIAVYMNVCFLQLALMLFVGYYILPLLGPEKPQFTFRLIPVVLVSFCAALAATGFGVLVGSAATNHEQASVFGAIAIIIASAVGGVMAPVYAMPHLMRQLAIGSPLNWGLEAFLDAFLREKNLSELAPNLLRLTGFFLATTAAALLIHHRRKP